MTPHHLQQAATLLLRISPRLVRTEATFGVPACSMPVRCLLLRHRPLFKQGGRAPWYAVESLPHAGNQDGRGRTGSQTVLTFPPHRSHRRLVPRGLGRGPGLWAGMDGRRKTAQTLRNVTCHGPTEPDKMRRSLSARGFQHTLPTPPSARACTLPLTGACALRHLRLWQPPCQPSAFLPSR